MEIGIEVGAGVGVGVGEEVGEDVGVRVGVWDEGPGTKDKGVRVSVGVGWVVGLGAVGVLLLVVGVMVAKVTPARRRAVGGGVNSASGVTTMAGVGRRSGWGRRRKSWRKSGRRAA